MTDGLPQNVSANDLRRLADAQERTADALEAFLDLKRKELTGEIQKKGYHGERKDPKVWIACAQEVVRLLETEPFVGWDDIKELPAFRDDAQGNMKRSVQWRRFLKQHLIPRTPEYGPDAHLIALGKGDKDGPDAIALQTNLHCAKRALDNVPDNAQYGDFGPAFDPQCGFCVAKKAKDDAERKARAAKKVRELETLLSDSDIASDPKRLDRLKQELEWHRHMVRDPAGG